MKTSRDCSVEKSVVEFSPNSKNKDGGARNNHLMGRYGIIVVSSTR